MSQQGAEEILSRIENEADPEPCMAEIQWTLRDGDEGFANRIFKAVQDDRTESYVRPLLLEAVVGARSAKFDKQVEALVRQGLMDADYAMRFSAVAAAADLPVAQRMGLVEDIEALRADPSPDVRRAAGAFLLFFKPRNQWKTRKDARNPATNSPQKP